MFWVIASRSSARRFRRRLVSVSAPPAPKFQTSRGRRAWAAFLISGRVTKRGGGVMGQYPTGFRARRQDALSSGAPETGSAASEERRETEEAPCHEPRSSSTIP